MSFLHPDMLFLIPLVLILFGFLLTQKEAQATFFSEEVMAKLRVSVDSFTLQTRNILFMLMSILLVLALANPVVKEGKVEVKAKSADIMLALDISDSMLAEDVYPNRLKSAKKKAIDLLKLAPNERIGVIAFAKNSYLVSPLSFDHNAVGFLLRQLDTTSITEKGTNLMSMLQVVDRSIKKESKKYILMLSDGGDNSDFTKEIAFAKEKNIAIFVLGIGTLKGAPIKMKNGQFIKQKGEIIVSKLNENISKLATKTGGVYIENVRSDKDIETMLSEIEKHSQKRELKSEEIERFVPLFYYPLALALLFLLLAISSMPTRKTGVATLFVLFSLMSYPQDVKAGVLDFMQLKDAQKSYDSGDYKSATRAYKTFAEDTDNKESYYNAGNALYKEKKYAEAIKSYEKANFEDKSKMAKKYANIGNSYVKQSKPEMLKKAVEAYESSLKLQEDKDTRENLEAVKKALKKQEQKKQQDKKNDKNQKDKKSDKDKKDDKKKDSKDSKDSKSSDKDKKSDKQKEGKKGDKESDEKKDDMKGKKQDEKKKEQNKKSEAEKKAEQEKKKAKKEQLKELDKKDKDKKSQSQKAMSAQQEDKMSNAEEKKWLNQLNQQKNTYLYRLNNENNNMEDSNAKPW